MLVLCLFKLKVSCVVFELSLVDQLFLEWKITFGHKVVEYIFSMQFYFRNPLFKGFYNNKIF